MDTIEPEELPPGVSPVRYVMSKTDPKKEFHPINGFEEAKKDPDGVAVFEGDYGGQIMMTIRMKYVKCTERAFDLLLADLGVLAWGDHHQQGEGIYYERLSVGDGVAGGMGGGCVVDGVWAHPRFEKDGVNLEALGKAVGDILECRAERLPAGLKGKPRG
jgi:hypothetical protein